MNRWYVPDTTITTTRDEIDGPDDGKEIRRAPQKKTFSICFFWLFVEVWENFGKYDEGKKF